MATVITKPKVDITPDLLEEIKTSTSYEGQVILHFVYTILGNPTENKIRIWPSSFLYDHDSNHRSELVHVENISLYPEWLQCTKKHNYFTLIFSALPKSCTTFDFVEHCGNQFGAFEVRNISRNDTDVYFIRLS